jgi:small-conductance mechanosensitive channel/CRP-like cAMP-binding protein
MSRIAPDLLTTSAVGLLCIWIGARYVLEKHPRSYFAAQGTLFVCLTLLLRAYDLIPFEVSTVSPSHPTQRVLGEAVEIVWWLIGAWLVRAFLRLYLRLGSGQRETTLVQEILGALVYLVAIIAILTYVWNLPIKGLLATSGALAIVVGLALQSSLGEVFSGIVLNLERSYRVGEWIVVDGAVQGEVVETNWRTTHIRTASNDLAIVPNSVIAKSKITNCSQPTRTHTTTVSVRLDRSLAPDAGSDLLKEVVAGCTCVLHAAEPSVKLTDVTADSMEYAVGFSVADINSVDAAKADVLRRSVYAATVAGAGFAPRATAATSCGPTNEAGHHRLLEAIPLFDSLTPEERAGLLDKMSRRSFPADSVIARSGTVMESLVIVGRGVLIAWEDDDGVAIESTRLTPGFYFGEIGVLAGEPLGGNVTALTHVVIYEIGKDALAPVLKARPVVADQLGETLELREQARRNVLSQHRAQPPGEFTIAGRFADTIRRLFALH